jgi:hypothetical protein
MKDTKHRQVGSNPVAGNPGSAFALSHSQGRSSYDVRAAVRRRTARRDMLIRWGMVATLLAALLCGAYTYLL